MGKAFAIGIGGCLGVIAALTLIFVVLTVTLTIIGAWLSG